MGNLLLINELREQVECLLVGDEATDDVITYLVTFSESSGTRPHENSCVLERAFEKRLEKSSCLVIYDAEKRYRKSSRIWKMATAA